MTVKSFFADTVAAAMHDARQEFGDEAILLVSRRAPEDYKHLGAYEVVFGASSPAAHDARNDPQSIWEAPEPVAIPRQPATESRLSCAEALYRRLVDLDFDERLARQFAERVEARLLAEGLSARDNSLETQAALGDSVADRVIGQEIQQFFPIDSALGTEPAGTVVALIGPPGAGKTSAVIGLAVAHGLARGRGVMLLAADDHRVAGDGRLHNYASLLGIEVRASKGTEELRDHLQGGSSGDLILIDTPGYGAADISHGRNLARLLAEQRGIQKHLVLPATLRAEDLRRTARRFDDFQPDRLLFTRLDETDRVGPAFSESVASQKPISFFTAGQQIPGDLTPADQFSLLALIGRQERAMRSAA